MSKYADTINSFYTKSEKYTNEIVLENFGLLRRMYSNYLTTETYKHWNWSWSYMIQLAFDENKFRILVQFDNLPLTAGHLLAFKAILYKKNSQITKSSECICLKEHCWLTNNSNTLELCSMTELEEFICKDTLRLMVIVRYEEKQKTTNRLTFRPLFFFRHDWLVKSQHLESTLSDKKLSICQQKFLDDIKSLSNQTETSDVCIRVHNKTYPCHRVILSARSNYFQKLFQSNFTEKTQREIDLSSFLLNENDFDLLHAYFYKAEINLNHENILQYIQLSDQFLLDDLYEFCEDYLLTGQHINETNILNILDIYYTLQRKISVNIQEKCFLILKTTRQLLNEQSCQDLLKKHPQLALELVKYFV